MSRVTDVILTASLQEEPGETRTYPAVEELNTWLRERRFGELKEVSEAAGGTRAMQALVFLGAFNYLDLSEFVEAVKAAPWRDSEGIALFVKQEEEWRFTDVTPNTQANRTSPRSG